MLGSADKLSLHPNSQTVKALYGPQFPLMSINERILNLMTLNIVDDIIFNAPFSISKNMINNMNVHKGNIYKHTRYIPDIQSFKLCFTILHKVFSKFF